MQALFSFHACLLPVVIIMDQPSKRVNKPRLDDVFYNSCLDHGLSSQQQNHNGDCASAFLTIRIQDSILLVFQN